MGFPETRLTLIQRLAAGGTSEDWQQFLADYWGAACRFAARWGGGNPHDAEDVAAEAFEVLLSRNLLERWQRNRAAKLRTLICQVIRNILSNRARVADGRRRLLQKRAAEGGQETFPFDEAVPDEQSELFYASWAHDLLQQSVDSLMSVLHGEGKGDQFRVLFGRLCEGMTMPEISAALSIKTTTAENHYKAAKKRLVHVLKENLRRHVDHYSSGESAAEDFELEWRQLAQFLQQHGGLSDAVRRAYQETAGGRHFARQSDHYRTTLRRFGDARSSAGKPSLPDLQT